MSQDALGQLKHLKTARARWPFPDVLTSITTGGMGAVAVNSSDISMLSSSGLREIRAFRFPLVIWSSSLTCWELRGIYNKHGNVYPE